MRTYGTQSAAAILAHALNILTPVIVDLLSRAHSTQGFVLRDATVETLLLFPTLVLGPRRPGASSSSVRIDVVTMLDLWRRGDLHELARRAKALACQRPPPKRIKSARAARRAARLTRKNRFARSASLAGILRVANATEDTLASLKTLFPKSSEVTQAYLLDYYDPPAPPQPGTLPIQVILETLRKCIAGAPPLPHSSPYKDGLRVEHLVSLTTDQSCGEALATLMTTIVKEKVSKKIANLLSSVTLVILLKKTRRPWPR